MKYRILIFCLYFSSLSNAQQLPVQTLWWNTQSIYNPAYSGLHNKQAAGISGRYQWTGIEHPYESALAFYDQQLFSEKMGIGGNYSYNHVGNTQTSNRFHVNLNYAFRFKHSSLRIGIAPGIQRLRMDYPAWITTSPQPDPALPQSGAQTKFSFNSGVAWTNDKLSLNFGVCQLTKPYFDKVKFHSAPEYFLGLTYSTALPNGSTLNPSFHMEKNGPSSQIQTALFFHHQKGPQLGGFWRRQDSSGVIIGFQKKKPFLFQYVFEIATGSSAQFRKYSHELHIVYLLKKEI